MHKFIRKITRKPVLDNDGKLRSDIVQIIQRLRAKGKDPIQEFTNCRNYLEDAIARMMRDKDLYCKWELYGKQKFTPGTRASLKYMLSGVKTILSVLAMEKFNSLFDSPSS